MSYTFELYRNNGTWTAYNPEGEEISEGDLPLTKTEKMIAVLDDKGVEEPTREALAVILSEDWGTVDNS